MECALKGRKFHCYIKFCNKKARYPWKDFCLNRSFVSMNLRIEPTFISILEVKLRIDFINNSQF